MKLSLKPSHFWNILFSTFSRKANMTVSHDNNCQPFEYKKNIYTKKNTGNVLLLVSVFYFY